MCQGRPMFTEFLLTQEQVGALDNIHWNRIEWLNTVTSTPRDFHISSEFGHAHQKPAQRRNREEHLKEHLLLSHQTNPVEMKIKAVSDPGRLMRANNLRKREIGGKNTKEREHSSHSLWQKCDCFSVNLRVTPMEMHWAYASWMSLTELDFFLWRYDPSVSSGKRADGGCAGEAEGLSEITSASGTEKPGLSWFKDPAKINY